MFSHVKKDKKGGKRCIFRVPNKENPEEAFLIGLGCFLSWTNGPNFFLPFDFIRVCYNFNLNTVSKIFGVSKSLLKKYFTKPTRKNVSTPSVFPDDFRLRISKIAYWPASQMDSADKEMILEKRQELRNIHASSEVLLHFLDNMMRHDKHHVSRLRKPVEESEPAAEAAPEPSPSARMYQPLSASELSFGAVFAPLHCGMLGPIKEDLDLSFWDSPAVL